MRRLLPCAAALLAAMLALPLHAAAPAFSCAHARRADERAICRSPALAAMDRRLAGLFGAIQGCTAMGGHAINLEDQRAWLRRRAQCGANTACLARRYRLRIAAFAPHAAKARQLLRSGDCPGPL